MNLKKKKIKLEQILNNFLHNQFASDTEALISLTQLKLDDNCSFAQIYLSVLPFDFAQDVIKQINRQKPEIKKAIAKSKTLPKVPRLEFKLDESQEYGQNLKNVINNL